MFGISVNKPQNDEEMFKASLEIEPRDGSAPKPFSPNVYRTLRTNADMSTITEKTESSSLLTLMQTAAAPQFFFHNMFHFLLNVLQKHCSRL